VQQGRDADALRREGIHAQLDGYGGGQLRASLLVARNEGIAAFHHDRHGVDGPQNDAAQEGQARLEPLPRLVPAGQVLDQDQVLAPRAHPLAESAALEAQAVLPAGASRAGASSIWKSSPCSIIPSTALRRAGLFKEPRQARPLPLPRSLGFCPQSSQNVRLTVKTLPASSRLTIREEADPGACDSGFPAGGAHRAP